MDVYEALYTTRAMRRVKPDPIPFDVQKKILDAAVRAPSGGNAQNWRFLLIDDAGVKAKLAPVYRACMDILWTSIYKDRVDEAKANPERWRLAVVSVPTAPDEEPVVHYLLAPFRDTVMHFAQTKVPLNVADLIATAREPC